jgi:FKBP-type peptidyl-prolyl cis-trans isomerase FkpA
MRKNILFLGLAATISCNGEVTGLEPPSDPATETFAASLGVNLDSMTKNDAGVWYLDVTVGAGLPDTATTDSVTINYVGRIKDGSQFDASNAVTFRPVDLIVGMRTGLYGMKEGGKRKIVIPSALGYGPNAIRDTLGGIKIPRQSTLIFDIDLTKVYNKVDTTVTPGAFRKP